MTRYRHNLKRTSNLSSFALVGVPLTVPNTLLRLASVESPSPQPCKDSAWQGWGRVLREHWEASSPTRSQHSSFRAQGWRLNRALGNHVDLVNQRVGVGTRPPSFLFPKILLFIKCLYVCGCATEHVWKSQGNSRESFLSFHHTGPEDPTRVRFGEASLSAESSLPSFYRAGGQRLTL